MAKGVLIYLAFNLTYIQDRENFLHSLHRWFYLGNRRGDNLFLLQWDFAEQE